MKKIVLCTLSTLMLIIPKSGMALAFQPTESEWATWPEYCRARYVVSAAGRNSPFASRVSRSDVASQEAQIGQAAWHWLHHYCAGVVHIDRGRQATNKRDADSLFDFAERQFMGQYLNLPKSNAFFPQLAHALGRLYRAWGKPEEAIKYTTEAIQYHPDHSASYSLASIIYRDEGQLTKAREILVQGNAATRGSSAEIHYFLGLILIELNDLEGAVEHAKKAYEYGYPLPGLRNKLKRLGRSLS